MNISLTAIRKNLTTFLGRYHFIIFIVYIVGSASYAIVLISSTVALSDEPNGYVSTTNSTSFDEETMARLRQLKDGNQATDKIPITGRVSPF